VLQCRDSDLDRRTSLVNRLSRLVHLELGIDCYIELVPSHTLPRTSSGKLSRSKARQQFIDRHDPVQLKIPAPKVAEPGLKLKQNIA
jgi:fatty-acyl-CoA synthase